MTGAVTAAAPDDLRNSAAMEALIAVSGQLRQGIIGQDHLTERLLTALLAPGHALIEGPPGLAKTRAVRLLAAGLSGSFARIQSTPDLMPSDITGTQVYHPDSGSFSWRPGPLFHNLVLVDEINRAPPKVQSALLEAMAEHQVTSGGETRPLPDPFLVLATRNPIEHEGTFPLPEAQLDRFLLQINLSFPGHEAERAILDLVEAEGRQGRAARPAVVLPGPEVIAAARAHVAQIHLAPALKDFIVRLVIATRDTAGGPLEGLVGHAVSPRGTLALAAAARARAALNGRDHALPEDVTDLAGDALGHRIIPGWRATAEGLTGRDLIARLLGHVRPW